MSLLVTGVCKRALKRPRLRQSFTCSCHKLKDVQQQGEGSPSLARLSHRLLVSVRGKDSNNFLQRLVTADMAELDQRKVMYSAFLNTQGRVLYDVILYHQGDGRTVIECDAGIIDDVIKHLRKYTLRSNVIVDNDRSREVWVAYPDRPDSPLKEGSMSYTDPRISSFGRRILTPASSSEADVAPSLPTSSPEDYRRYRLELGVAEGPAEVPIGACFPLEYNIDYLNGVSFTKGCYLGQELTARTHHTGVIRKRVAPVTFEQRDGVEVVGGTKIVNGSGKNVGKLICHLGGTGLALLRVQEMNGPLSFQSEVGSAEGVSLASHTPPWWPPLD